MIVFCGSVSKNLSEKVSRRLNADIGLIEHRLFPDGEHYMRILSEVKGEDCVVIQSTNSNDAFMELLLLLDALRDFNAQTIHTFMPYMGYSRQDRRFKEREAFSAKTVLELINQFSDSITTINCHFLDSEGVFDFEGVDIRNIDAGPLVADYFKEKTEDLILISPDRGAFEYVRRAAKAVNCEFDYLEKTRISDDKVRFTVKEVDVSGRDVVILDDMISTGGTILEAARFIRAQKAKSVSAGCVHGVFSRGLQIFGGVLDELACTDSISQQVSRISVSGLISEVVSNIL
ncbi:MAG: ribose-phosphate diphosphokinase [Candidatus Altiarchaeota archaeon]|nr:ribose-phosphate diphosphokinase [Candidatus Altiarchaeota archaeon]